MSRGPWKLKGDARAYTVSHIKIPRPAESAHLLIHFLYHAIYASRRTLRAITELSGVTRMTLYDWFARAKNPRLSHFESVLNAAGFGIEIVPINPEKLTWRMFQEMEKTNAELKEMRELLNDDLPYPSAVQDEAAAKETPPGSA